MFIYKYIFIYFQFKCNKYQIFKYILALSEAEGERWLRGLRYLVDDTIKAPYPHQVQVWLRREFYAMEGPRET